MENQSLVFIGLFAKGQCQEQPDAIIAVDSYHADEVTVWINRINESYDSNVGVEGTAEGRIEYILEALQETFPFEVVTDNLLRMDL